MVSTPTEGSGRSKLIVRPTTVKEAALASPFLTFEDKRELIASGLNPLEGLPFSVEITPHPVAFETASGALLGFGGVIPESDGIGRIWMLTLEALKGENPRPFLRTAKEYLNALPYVMLYNSADTRNKLHLKLLHLLGFKKLACFKAPSNVTFVEFAKLCAHQ